MHKGHYTNCMSMRVNKLCADWIGSFIGLHDEFLAAARCSSYPSVSKKNSTYSSHLCKTPCTPELHELGKGSLYGTKQTQFQLRRISDWFASLSEHSGTSFNNRMLVEHIDLGTQCHSCICIWHELFRERESLWNQTNTIPIKKNLGLIRIPQWTLWNVLQQSYVGWAHRFRYTMPFMYMYLTWTFQGKGVFMESNKHNSN